MPEIHVSTGVEADRPIPGPRSMLSFGPAAAFLADRAPVGTSPANPAALPCGGPRQIPE